MKAKKYWLLIITSLVFFVAMGHITWVAGNVKKIPLLKVAPNQRDVLVGLQGVMVVVEKFNGGEKYGLTKQSLRADVESRLRQHGVKVVAEEEWAQTPGMPWLYVNVILLSDQESRLAVVSIKVELYERTLLLRDTTTVTNAATWRKWMARFLELNNLNEVRKSAMDLIDEFVNDYLAANPKKQVTKSESKKPNIDFMPDDQKQMNHDVPTESHRIAIIAPYARRIDEVVLPLPQIPLSLSLAILERKDAFYCSTLGNAERI